MVDEQTISKIFFNRRVRRSCDITIQSCSGGGGGGGKALVVNSEKHRAIRMYP